RATSAPIATARGSVLSLLESGCLFLGSGSLLLSSPPETSVNILADTGISATPATAVRAPARSFLGSGSLCLSSLSLSVGALTLLTWYTFEGVVCLANLAISIGVTVAIRVLGLSLLVVGGRCLVVGDWLSLLLSSLSLRSKSGVPGNTSRTTTAPNPSALGITDKAHVCMDLLDESDPEE
ncbi:hypothetical protein PMAYCL1PPCAC_07668, partial [Pristionchus mayeri]